MLFLAPAALVALLYWPTMVPLVRTWDTDPNYSHGFAVPALSLAFVIWAVKRRGGAWPSQVGRGEAFRGLLEIALGLGLHCVAIFLGHLLLDVLSLICVLRGAVLALGGREANRTFGFAALFLIFMAPLPPGWYQPVARLLQELVSDWSSRFLAFGGVAVFREGYILHLPGCTVEVGEACSGMRQLTGILALAVAVGYFASQRSWYRWTLALASLPIAILANCLRVILNSVVLLVLGPRWAGGVLHDMEGLITAALASGLLFVLAWGLSRLERSGAAGLEAPLECEGSLCRS